LSVRYSLTTPEQSHNPAESNMNAPDVFGQVRPFLSLAGSIAIVIGLIDFAGLGNIPGSGLETAVAGFLAKNV